MWPWTWRQQSNLLAWHSGPWWCITIPNLVTKGSAVEETLSRYTFTEIVNLSSDLDHDHNRAVQSFHRTIRLMLMCNQTNSGRKRISNSEDNNRNCNILIIWALAITLTLKIANQSSCMTLWPMMVHHQFKFAFRRFSSWGDIIQMNRHRYLETFLWLRPRQQHCKSNLFTRQSSLWCHQT